MINKARKINFFIGYSPDFFEDEFNVRYFNDIAYGYFTATPVKCDGEDVWIYMFDQPLDLANWEPYGLDPNHDLNAWEDLFFEDISIKEQMVPWDNGMYFRNPTIREVIGEHPYWLYGVGPEFPALEKHRLLVRDVSYFLDQDDDTTFPKIQGWDEQDEAHGGPPPFHCYMCDTNGNLVFYPIFPDIYVRPVFKLKLGSNYELTQQDINNRKKTISQLYAN